MKASLLVSFACLVVSSIAIGCSAGSDGTDQTGPSSTGGASGSAGSSSQSEGGQAGQSAGGSDGHSRFLTEVVSFTPGQGAGFGQDKMPGIVLGPPDGAGDEMGSTDCVSLGHLGEIVVAFGENEIVDGDGVDFLVFENAFYAGGDPNNVFAEPAEIAVSDDGMTWTAFPCDPMNWQTSSCAGVHPVYSNPMNGISPFDPAKAGGDPFDLAAIGVKQARYVRVRDMSMYLAPPTAGFDLDAMAIVNAEYE